MKKILLFLFTIILLIPIYTKALTEDEARKAIVDYAYYIYNNKKDDIVYVEPKLVQQEKIFLGYKTQSNYYAMDCNAFVGFVIYNAFRIEANANGSIPQNGSKDGPLTSSGRPALNGNDGWSTHSSLYDSNRYMLKKGETIQSAVSRINLQSKLKPGDLIAVVGFGSSSYNSQEEANKSTHIMIYVGDGKYIHNRKQGVSLNDLSEISYGNRVGSTFPDSKGNTGPHGAITVLTLRNYESIPSSVLDGYRYPTGTGSLIIENASSTTPQTPHQPKCRYQAVEGLQLCERKDIAGIVRIITTVILIIRIAVPILLILSIMIALVKAITKNDNDELNKVLKTSVKKIIAAVLVFLIPTFVNVIMMIASVDIKFDDCIELSKNPKETIEYVCDGEDGGDTPVADDDTDYKKDGTYITLSNKDVTGYYFSSNKESLTDSDSRWIPSSKNKIDFVLLPGKHYAYIRTKNGIIEKEINITTKDISVTNDKTDITILSTDIDTFLKSKGSSLEELNKTIERSVYIAGGSSKNGSAAASLALTQTLYNKYKVKIPYGSTYPGSHIVNGVPPSWGSDKVTSTMKKGLFLNSGIHCGGFVSWAYTQANFSMSSGIGSSKQICGWGYGRLHKITNTNRGNVGDVVTYAKTSDESKHVAIISAMDENGYYVTEANARTKMIDGVKTLIDNIGIVTTFEPYNNTRFISYIDMSNTVSSKLKKTSLSNGF